MFMENKRDQQVFPLELYCTTQEKKPVNVHVTSPKSSSPSVDETFTVTDGQVHKTLVDSTFRMTGNSVSSKAIRITADAEIACYGANKETLSNDVYLGLPVDALGTDYYAMAYSPASVKTELGIASTDDSTNVKITLPSGNGNVDVTFKGKTYHAGDVINIQLQKYDTLQLQSSGDLTGKKYCNIMGLRKKKTNTNLSYQNKSISHIQFFSKVLFKAFKCFSPMMFIFFCPTIMHLDLKQCNRNKYNRKEN